MGSTRLVHFAGPAAIAVALLAGLLTASCGTGADGTLAPPTTSASVTARSAAATTVDAGIASVCANLLLIDAVPLPDSTSPADDAYGRTVRPLLDAALGDAPTELVRDLAPFDEAIQPGEPVPLDDPAVMAAVASYEAWAHEHCGYQNVDLMAMDYEFQNLPEVLPAGPVSFSLMNHSERGEFHAANLAKLRPNDPVGLAELVDIPIEQLATVVDLVPATALAAAGTTGGMLVDLTPGRYVLLCASRSDPGDPSTGHLRKGMLTEFTVE